MDNIINKHKEIKQNYQDVLVLFRNGDFYNAICNDAIDCSKILSIRTFRMHIDKLYYQFASFRFNKLDDYLPKLISAGKRVVICVY